jgi:hypothetical protein
MMCERCDRDLAAFSEQEVQHDAEGVAAIAPFVLAEAIPASPHSVLIAAAAGHALAKVTERLASAAPGESFTPAMRQMVERLGDLAAETIVGAYERVIVTPDEARVGEMGHGRFGR